MRYDPHDHAHDRSCSVITVVHVELMLIPHLKTYRFDELLHATRDFSPSCFLGEGGFGRVYRAMLGMAPVAIKVLDQESMQGQQEFSNEISLAELSHPHLVTLKGFCREPPCLLYELMSRGNLEEALRQPGEALSFNVRVRVATQVSYALSYLHSRGFIHRDIKSSNIFLDADLNAKVGDLGLATNIAQGEVSSRPRSDESSIQGDWQWMAPELRASGRASLKSDVFSFGLLLIQMLTGSMRPKEVVAKVIAGQEEGSAAHVLDPRMMARGGVDGLLVDRMVKLGLWMTLKDPAQRPSIDLVFSDLQLMLRRLE